MNVDNIINISTLQEDDNLIIKIKRINYVKPKKYPVIQVPSNGNPNWSCGARTMCFVYSKKGNFILEGYLGEVEDYLKKNYTHYFYYMSMWHNSQSRGYWKFWKENVTIYSPSKHGKTWKYKVIKYDYNQRGYSAPADKVVLEFKRLPKRWIPEFNKLT